MTKLGHRYVNLHTIANEIRTFILEEPTSVYKSQLILIH